MNTSGDASSTSFLVVIQIAVWISACRDDGPAPEEPGPLASSDVIGLVRRADDALDSAFEPDYRRPLVQGPDVQAQVSRLYLQACDAGDKRSCWMADAIDRSMETLMRVRSNCLEGDVMSCRALATDPAKTYDARLAGWAGRAGCDQPECRGTLAQECEAGFPTSCRMLEPSDAEPGSPLETRSFELAREGCRAGLLGECEELRRNFFGESDQRLTWTQYCRLALKHCVKLGIRKSIESRDLMERACQYGRGSEQSFACLQVMHGYYQRRYPEPIPGRALALAEWNCKQIYKAPAACIQEERIRWQKAIAP